MESRQQSALPMASHAMRGTIRGLLYRVRALPLSFSLFLMLSPHTHRHTQTQTQTDTDTCYLEAWTRMRHPVAIQFFCRFDPFRCRERPGRYPFHIFPSLLSCPGGLGAQASNTALPPLSLSYASKLIQECISRLSRSAGLSPRYPSSI